MHIPDGFVSLPVGASTGLLAAAGVSYAIWRTGRTMPKARAPMLGLSAAFIFAAQIINFPVIYGVSGHLLGAALAAVLLGPSAAIVALSCVVLLQCFMFADGGLSALGANTLNMGIIGVISAYAAYRAVLLVTRDRHRPAAAAIAGWVSVVITSLACASQIALSRKIEARLVIPAMLFTHALIGIGEALITAMVIGSLEKARPELLDQSRPQTASRWGSVLVYGTLASLALALFVSPFACPWPDGLEHVAARLGFDTAAAQPVLTGWMPDYRIAVFGEGKLSTAIAGAVGTICVLALGLLIGRLVQGRKPAVEQQPAGKQ
jgi:cobalt/nickel transport system permease protein